MCLYPRLIKNRKYTVNKKNGGQVPPVTDERTRYVPVGCGECMECRKQKARGWQVRLLEDIKTNTNGKFITLTFSNEAYTKLANEIAEIHVEKKITLPTGYELDNQIATLAMRRFNENWRSKHGKALRHWMITELGHNGTENIHMHGIVWTDQSAEEVKKMWLYGFTWVGKYVNAATINYMVKYVTKKDLQHKTFKSKILTSPGIGANYMDRQDWKNNTFKEQGTDETYRTSSGHKIAMPIYWRNKIYSEIEREKLWIQRLDTQTRFVCGEKISIKHGEGDYEKALKYHQVQNIRLGYGTGEKDWNREVYERQRRIMVQKQRMVNKYNKDVES